MKLEITYSKIKGNIKQSISHIMDLEDETFRGYLELYDKIESGKKSGVLDIAKKSFESVIFQNDLKKDDMVGNFLKNNKENYDYIFMSWNIVE